MPKSGTRFASFVHMSGDSTNLRKLGGISFIASGALFATRSTLELLAGPPPSTGTDILAWVAAEKHFVMFVNEVLFFATMLLVPAFAALYQALSVAHARKAVIGCGSAAAMVPLLACVLVVHGRLVYPVFHIQVHTADMAELVVGIYYGGIHAVALIMALSTITLAFAFWRHARRLALLGFVTTAADLAAAYPDAIGAALTFACGLFFAGWLVSLGVWLMSCDIGTARGSDGR